MGASAASEFFERRATLSAGASVGIDQVGQSDDPVFDQQLWTWKADLGWTHIINPRFETHLVYTLERRDGYQANPYRYVPIFADAGAFPNAVLPEQVPSVRDRHAVEALGLFSATADLFLHGGYRLYADSWGITSHTARAEMWWLFRDDTIRTRFRLRGYNQTGADFYRVRYREAEGWRTGDYRLSPMSTATAGAHVSWRIVDWPSFEVLALGAGYDATYYHFEDYAVRDSMLGHLLSLNLTMETP